MAGYYQPQDPFETEVADSGRSYDSPARRPLASDYDYRAPSPYTDTSRSYQSPSQGYAHSPYGQSHYDQSPYDHQGSYAPEPPRHGDNPGYVRGPPAHGERANYGYAQPGQSNITPGADNFSNAASGGMAGVAYNVADRMPRESGMQAAHSQLPPPPSRTATNHGAYGGGYTYDSYSNRGMDSPMRSNASSVHNLGYHRNDSYADDPYQGASSSSRSGRLGEVNPNDIEDDGDDGLHYPRRSQRNSMLSSGNSDRGGRPAFGAAAAAGGATAAGGLLSRNRQSMMEYNLADGSEKRNFGEKKGMSKRCRWIIILIVAVVIVGGIIGGVVGGVVMGNRSGGGGGGSGGSAKGGGHSGQSAEEDMKENGDLDINSSEIKGLMNNKNFHKVFPGMDYTPINAQYPYCLHDPPSQNNITRDIAVLSQLTNKVRTYGTDCNQTEMVIHAIKQLDLEDDVKIWMGVWQDKNETTNARQLEQMWDILDKFGDKHFEGLIVANEILFREEMTINTLAKLLSDVRTNLTRRDLDLPVATSDLGDDWSTELADDSDYLMSNIHPFFAGVPADEAASWTIDFWNNNNGDFMKTDKKKNIISETGWPTGGGTNCGSDKVTSCSNGSESGVEELNTFMEDWVCSALNNGTQYFWFSAFDEPWKERFNEKGKEWEDKWGLMDVDRNLKKGVKIPDCGGSTI